MSEISAIDGWLEKLAEMTPEVKENTVKSLVMATKKWRWTPTAGPQFQACFCEADELMAVVAGHKIPENPDDPRIIGETRKYLRDFIAWTRRRRRRASSTTRCSTSIPIVSKGTI